MKKIITILLALSLVLTLAACGSESEPAPADDLRPTAESFITPDLPDEPEIPEEPEASDESDAGNDDHVVPPQVNEHGFIWLVEPALDYDGIYYCNGHDMFWGNNEEKSIYDQELDTITGQPTGGYHGAHGGGREMWVYDHALDIMGTPGSGYSGTPVTMYPHSEFAEHFPDDADTIKIVYSVDSTIRNNDGGSDYIEGEAYAGAAVAVGSEFITDFIYHTDSVWIRRGRDVYDTIEVLDKNNMYGIINRKGETAVPFIFSEIIMISSNTAFARLAGDDMWGIIKFGTYVPLSNPQISFNEIGQLWLLYDSLKDYDEYESFSADYEYDTAKIAEYHEKYEYLAPWDNDYSVFGVILWWVGLNHMGPDSAFISTAEHLDAYRLLSAYTEAFFDYIS
ncbi:MAG: hypothetical protein FWE74_10235 [Oscillospiraceae bacterium]|nr:hypothetical protein [Oscillospiraceae bacterium]